MSGELFDPPGIIRSVDALAELAGRINAEHQQAETALRAGLEHARRAGELLLQAKTQCRHGEWLPWLTANVQCSKRTAQAYMRVARRWEELESKAQRVALLTGKSDTVSDLPYRDAMNLLTGPTAEDEDEIESTETTDLPPALAYYQDAGLIDEECVRLLCGLEEDYGPEIVAEFKHEPFAIDNSEDAYFFLNQLRPLDHPTLWPLSMESLPAAVLEGVRLFVADIDGRGNKIPRWEVAATWWASQAIHVAHLLKDRMPMTMAEVLEHHLTVWRDSLYSALYYVVSRGRKKIDDEMAWWGYLSDLRHAGIRDAFEAMTLSPAILDAFQKGVALAQSERSYASPSYQQKQRLGQEAS